MWQLNRIPMALSISLVTLVTGLIDLGNGCASQLGDLALDGLECFFGCTDHRRLILGIGLIIGIGHPLQLKNLTIGSHQFSVFGDFIEVIAKVILVACMGR